MKIFDRGRQLNLRDCFLITLIISLLLLMFTQQRRLLESEKRAADLTLQIHRQTVAKPVVEIYQPGLLTMRYHPGASIAIGGFATIPASMQLAAPTFEVELIEAQTGKTVSTDTLIAPRAAAPERTEFSHTIEPKTLLTPGAYIIVVYLLNKEGKRAAKGVTVIQVVDPTISTTSDDQKAAGATSE